VQFHDATLRDGEQTPGVVFRKEEKVEIARKLSEVGVERIEAGMPAVSEEDAEATKEIVSLKLPAKTMVLCRTIPREIDMALKCGVWGVVLEAPSGEVRIKYQFGWTEEDVLKNAVSAVKYAKQNGLFVNFFPFDTTRARWPFLERLLSEVMEAGADSISVVDTTGVALPSAIGALVRRVKNLVKVPVEVHTHNDFGLAVAGTLAGVEAGAGVVHVAANGLGERCGNASLDEVAVCLKALYGIETNLRYDKLYELALLVQERSGVPMAQNKPVAGRMAFGRESGMGMDVIQEHPTVIFPIRPEFVGRKFEMFLGKKSGKPSVKVKLDALGLQASDQQIEEILKLVKARGIEKKGTLTDEEFYGIVREVKKS
jgi:methanogen homocitrate synthase